MKQASIVLFERDEFARGVYKGYLSAEGFPLRVESKLDPLLRVVRDEDPALVVATFDTPFGGPSIGELCARLRAARPRTALLAIVRREDPSAPMRALGAGALDILRKPVSGESLVVAVKRCLATVSFLAAQPELRRSVETYLSHRRIVVAPDPVAVAEALLDAVLVETDARTGLALRLTGGASELLATREDPDAAALPAWPELARELQQQWAVADSRAARTVGGLITVRAQAASDRIVVAVPSRGPLDGALAARLEAHAAQARAALELAARYPEGTGEPTIDPLTDLPDARSLQRAVADAIARAVHVGGQGLAVLAVDLVGFRNVNDRHGHLTGGRVLVEAARVLSRLVRDVDLVARIGADEFGILLSAADGRGAVRVAERIRDAFGRHRFLAREGLELSMGIRIGAGVYPQHGLTARDLIAAAQRAILGS
jgi:diguanylate cyclase (GGDEF)-like protein